MTKADIQRLVQQYQDKELDEWEEEHIAGSLSADRDTISLILTDRLEETTVHLTEADYSKIKSTAETLLKDHNRSLPADSPEFTRLCHSLGSRLIVYLELTQAKYPHSNSHRYS